MTAAATVPFPVTPRRPGDPECDLTGFTLIHRALRSGARELAVALSRGAPAGRARRDAIARHARHVLSEVHSHHEKEDDVLWPVIVASTAGRVDLGPLTDDHRALAGVLDRCDRGLTAFERGDDDADWPAALTELADMLDEHIVEEEATVFPVMREYVSHADFARCERMFQKGASGSHLLFVLPWIAAQCTPAELATVTAQLPPPLRLLLRLSRGRWERRRALVVG